MSYGHAEKLAAILAGRTSTRADAHPIDPRVYDRPEVRPILAERDIAAVFQLLKKEGITQRTIADLVSMQQSQVSEILAGRKVIAYDVLVRIAEGLLIPRGFMGLMYATHGETSTYHEDVTAASSEEVAMMLRRHVLLLAPIATLAPDPIMKLAEMAEVELPSPSPTPRPSRLEYVHVRQTRDTIRQLAESRRAYGADSGLNSAAAEQATQLLDVSGTEEVTKAMMTAVAQLHLQAGWSGFDDALYDRAMYHYARALELAIKAGDSYCQALALSWAGLASIEHDDPNEGLKILQFGLTKVLAMPSELDPDVYVFREQLQACMLTDAATAYHHLDYPEVEREADAHLARGRELWISTSVDTGGDLDRPAACIALDRGRFDTAESHAVASMRRWEGMSNVGRANSAIVLATIYVRAGEPRGLPLAHSAIAAAGKLTSMRPRKRLTPLIDALDVRSRTSGDAQYLARLGRRVRSTRM